MTSSKTATKTIPETCDIGDTNYNSDNWEPAFMTFCVTWQLRMTIDSIRNSYDVFVVTWCKHLPYWHWTPFQQCFFFLEWIQHSFHEKKNYWGVPNICSTDFPMSCSKGSINKGGKSYFGQCPDSVMQILLPGTISWGQYDSWSSYDDIMMMMIWQNWWFQLYYLKLPSYQKI